MNKQTSKYTFKGHGNAITNLAFSTDGKRLVSLGYDNRAILWDVETAKVLNVLPFGWQEQGCLSPDASRIATAKGVWDVASGDVIRRHRRWGILAYSPDGRLLVSCKRTWNPETCDETLDEITIFDSQTGRKKHTIMDGSAPFSVQLEKSFVFSPDGAYLAFLKEAPPQMEIKEGRRTSIIGDKTVCVYELKTKSLVEMSRSVSYAELLWRGSPSHERLVALGCCGSALWDAETGELLQEIHKYLRYPVESNGVLSPDGRLLALGTEDGVAVAYSVSDARPLWKKRCHLSWLQTLAFTSDSCKLASTGSDHSILISDAETGELLQTLIGRIPDVEALSFTPDGKHISALYDDDSARLWSVEARSLEKYEGAWRGFLGLMRSKTSQIARHYWNPALKDLLASLQHSPYWGLQAISHDGTLVSLVDPRGGYFFGGRDFQTDEEEEDAPAPNPVPTLASSLEDALHKHLHNTCGNKLIIAVTTHPLPVEKWGYRV